MSALSNHFQQITEALESYGAKIAALEAEIAMMKISDHSAAHLAFLLRLKNDYTQILQRYDGLAEGCRALGLGAAGLL